MTGGALWRIGWDLGGAHLKFAVAASGIGLVQVRQIQCPLWRGLTRLDEVLKGLAAEVNRPDAIHALTMTGELCDSFQDRAQGVCTLVGSVAAHLGERGLKVYAGPKGFVEVAEAQCHSDFIASANWHASVSFVACRCTAGVFIDIGSTTSDIVPFAAGAPHYRGYTDAERLGCEELVYTGVLRTPVIAVVRRVPLRGEWQPLVAEHFATMADVYSLTGQLNGVPATFLSGHETADGEGMGIEDCARRLARMAGHDLDPAHLEEWCAVAHYIAWTQFVRLRQAVERVCSRVPQGCAVPFVGAGIGRFLVAQLAETSARPYLDVSDLIDAPPALRPHAAACAPAVAVASLIAA